MGPRADAKAHRDSPTALTTPRVDCCKETLSNGQLQLTTLTLSPQKSHFRRLKKPCKSNTHILLVLCTGCSTKWYCISLRLTNVELPMRTARAAKLIILCVCGVWCVYVCMHVRWYVWCVVCGCVYGVCVCACEVVCVCGVWCVCMCVCMRWYVCGV